jgi:hypothetical protein
MSDMAATRQFTARMDTAVLERLERRAQRSEVTKSRLALRYIDEGLRMEEHPGIVFRSGPTGRRAGLAAGPDVWQVIVMLRASERTGEDAIAAVAEFANLTVDQVRNALRYYADFPDEVDERIRRNEEVAREAEAQWFREQNAVA